MTLSDLRTLIRASVPGAKTSVVSNTVMNLLINKAVDDVNKRGAVYQANDTFDVEADVKTYTLSDKVSEYYGMDESGLWWNDGSANNLDWKRLTSMSRRTLDDQYPEWKNEDADDPLRCVIEGDELIVDPTPQSALADGFWIFYTKKAVYMTNDTHYPFTGSTTEIATYRIFDDPIMDYVKWKLAAMVGKYQKGVTTEAGYDKSILIALKLFRRRLDISANPGLRMRGPTIG